MTEWLILLELRTGTDFIVIEEPPLDNWGMAGKQKSEGFED